VKVEAKVEMFTMVRASELFPLRQPIKVRQAKQAGLALKNPPKKSPKKPT
jgi:hypothetical protein